MNKSDEYCTKNQFAEMSNVLDILKDSLSDKLSLPVFKRDVGTLTRKILKEVKEDLSSLGLLEEVMERSEYLIDLFSDRSRVMGSALDQLAGLGTKAVTLLDRVSVLGNDTLSGQRQLQSKMDNISNLIISGQNGLSKLTFSVQEVTARLVEDKDSFSDITETPSVSALSSQHPDQSDIFTHCFYYQHWTLNEFYVCTKEIQSNGRGQYFMEIKIHFISLASLHSLTSSIINSLDCFRLRTLSDWTFEQSSFLITPSDQKSSLVSSSVALSVSFLVISILACLLFLLVTLCRVGPCERRRNHNRLLVTNQRPMQSNPGPNRLMTHQRPTYGDGQDSENEYQLPVFPMEYQVREAGFKY